MGKDESVMAGKNIAFIRNGLGETLSKFATRFNMSYAGLARIERGDVSPSIDYLKIISELSGRTIDDIIKIDFSKENETTEK